jgi:hypothetical protein
LCQCGHDKKATGKPPRKYGGPFRPKGQGKEAKAMFFLIRMAFWFSLVLLALPLGTSGDENSVGPVQALMAARDAVGDLAGICERKPDVCETGKSAMHTITIRAGEAARIAAGLLDDGKTAAPDTTTVTGSVPANGEIHEAAATTELPAEVDIPVGR